MLQKALVSRYFNEPVLGLEGKIERGELSLDELEKWSAAAVWIASEIDFRHLADALGLVRR